jgi:hypothetical protein
VRPVNAALTAAPDAVVPNGDCDAVTVLFPTVKVGEIPHVKVTVDDAPLDVPVPLIVAVVSVIDVAGSVVTEGAPGVVNCSIGP